jgi:endonuclease III
LSASSVAPVRGFRNPRPADGISSTPQTGHLPIRKICKALEFAYHNPRHGNKRNPLDELIYIILSTRTQDASFRSIFQELKRSFPSWNRLDGRNPRKLQAVLAPGGLGKLKSRQIRVIVSRLRMAFGRATLAPLRKMSDMDAEMFLTSLPGVAAKIAKCVLMYSLDRQVLPVDVHVHRVASRLGFQTKKRPDTSQKLIEKVVPPELRYGFHVNAVAHGRAICTARDPACEACCLANWCQYYRSRKASR